MAMYSDTELEAMMSDLESDLVERKESATDGKKIRRNVCAFANDLPENGKPGVVLVGVRDDGSCASLPIDDALLTGLANIRGEGAILPLPSMTVQKRVLKGREVAVVSVEPSADTPVRYQGRVWVRVGPSVREGSVEDERLLTERRRAADLPFDSRAVNGAHVSDLDQDFVRDHYLPNAIAPEVLERNTRPIEHQLRSLRLVQGEKPTWGAVIAFGLDPQAFVPGAYVQFLRIDGTEMTDPIRDRKQLTGGLADVVRRLGELLDLNVSVRTQVAGVAAGEATARLPRRCPAAARTQRRHAPQLRRNPHPGTDPLVLRPGRDCEPRWVVWKDHARQLRHGGHRLPQSASGRDHGQSGLRPTLRPRPAARPPSPGSERQPGA